MSALVASDVTFTVGGANSKINVAENGTGKSASMKIAFGDSTKTYPAGGIPLSGLSTQGFPTVIGRVEIYDESNADGLIYKWDSVNNKLRIYQSTASHTHTLFVATGATDATGARINAATNSFAMNNAAASVAGIAAASGAAGGVVNVAAGAGTEVATSFAPAATTLYALVSGF